MDKINVYKYSLFEQLITRGHRLPRTKPNERNPQYNVFVFKRSEALERDIAELTGYTYKKERAY
ncbi:hypothetical protein [Peribacillus frigoritolerans]|uniref:hypothetical protein n=1 Tax=Peribacillus frigoritolerans TaxID=450367 RepID=UPI002415A4DF|nr:hypothetical protein [Peribacillus frigoritolerans]MDG4850516.1 hypothetical protein [Peribacillus frigoritolerans]